MCIRDRSDTATITIEVVAAAINQAPEATDDTATTDQDQSVQIVVLANDTDPDGDLLSVAAIVQPLNGAVVSDATGTLTYAPAAGFFGVDTFTYDAVDADGAASTAEVTVIVNEVVINTLPVAEADLSVTVEDTPIIIDVLLNDTDADGDVLTVSAVTVPANGTATANADSTITYAPVAGFAGIDAFDYTVSDGAGGTATASVSITVNAVPAIGALLPATAAR